MGKKDVLHDFLKREDVDWRRFNLDTAKGVYKQQGLGGSRVKAVDRTENVLLTYGKIGR